MTSHSGIERLLHETFLLSELAQSVNLREMPLHKNPYIATTRLVQLSPLLEMTW